MSKKVIYLQELHSIYLLQPKVDYLTVIFLIDAYMSRYNIQWHRNEYETLFMQTAHNPMYNSEEAFCVLCEMYMNFSDAGALHERLQMQLQKQDVLRIPNQSNGTHTYVNAI